MDFGQRLRALLKRERLSQKEFGEATNTNTGLVSRYINGESPSGDFIMKVVHHFPNDVNYLFFGEGNSVDMVNEAGSEYQSARKIVDDIEAKIKKLKAVLPQE